MSESISHSSAVNQTTDKESNKPLFSNYLQIEQKFPQWLWQVLRILVLLAFFSLVASLVFFPSKTLQLFWGLLVPILPLVFWLAPGLWRNVCPLAMANQIPRKLNFSRAKELPAGLKKYANIVGISLLALIIPLRIILLNNSAQALLIALVSIISVAFIGGLFFKGKSGWCGSFCPLLPVQRLYGQSPTIEINNSHCKPCVGCTKNCFDFNPQAAYLADLYDSDENLGNDRKLFAGLLPGLLFAYFLPFPTSDINVVAIYAHFAGYAFVSIGLFYFLDSLTKLSASKLTALFSIISVNTFYWFASQIMLDTFQSLAFEYAFATETVWIIRGLVFLFSFYWLYKTLHKESLFLKQSIAKNSGAKVADITQLNKHGKRQAGKAVIRIMPKGDQLVADADQTLLELLEKNGHKINSGCRMGACGADPVVILEGEQFLPEKSAEEQATLERLGYEKGVRLACCIKASKDISINLDPSSVQQTVTRWAFKPDTDIQSVVIVGNGIAGVTAADFIRRHHPTCKIHLIGEEKYPLYNRMAISKLIYGKTALQSLILMPDEWYIDRNIEQWLNTKVASIDTVKRIVKLATSEQINFDRLIITTGSHARIPPIVGWPLNGCFCLRTADDGMNIRSFVQQHRCNEAIIAGGGLLGLEAAYALTQIGIKVTVLERSKQLLRRQLDAEAAKILAHYLIAIGISIRYSSEVKGVHSVAATNKLTAENRDSMSNLAAVTLKDDKKMEADLLIVAAGIETNQALTNQNDLTCKKGLLVNNRLQTSIKHIYAAGDIAEVESYQGVLPGLWPVAVEQGRIAAINAVGGNKEYQFKPIATGLKVVGVELTSMGKINADKDELSFSKKNQQQYKKIVLSKGKIVGCILLGHPNLAAKISGKIASESILSETEIEQLEQGNWDLFQ